MDTSKIIKGAVSNGRYTVTAPIVKEDYGLYLQIEDIELPSTYEVDFSNNENSGTSVTMIGNADGVLIPRQFIASGKDVFAFLYHVGEDFGRTVYKFRIPNKVRPDRTNEEPTPEEQSVIDQAISALNEAVAQTAQDVIDADASAQSAQEYAEQAETARNAAQTYANNASASAQASANSATASAQSASASAQIKSDIEGMVDDAQGYAQASAQSATASANSATTAQGYANTASASAQSASTSASDALTYANTASSKASEASTSAQTASSKASEASQSASTASTKASEATTAATSANTAKTDAVAAKTAAETAQGKAEDAQAAAESVAESIPSDYSQLSEDVSDLKEGLSKVVVSGNQLYNKGVGYVNGYARSADGSIRGENTSTCTSWFKCKGGQTYWINLKASYIGFYSGEPEWVLNPDDGYKYPTNYISGYLLNETSPANQITVPNDAKYVGFSVGHDYTLDTIMVNLGDSALPYEEYTLGVLNPSLDVPQVESVKNAIGLSDTSTFDVMYIKDGKACCGKTSNDVTAYYAGVELTGVPTDLDVKWIWEKGTTSGTVAIILNPNGLYRVSCITNWSLHIAITSTLLQATLMGDRVGQHYYANLINKAINLSLDGETENTAHVTISGNTLTVTINGTQYTGTLSDSTYSLTDFIGKYFIFEHYCTGDRNSVAMPMFTKVEATGGDCERFRDLFNRPSGQLCTSPQGYVYRLFTNLSTYQNYEQSPPVST